MPPAVWCTPGARANHVVARQHVLMGRTVVARHGLGRLPAKQRLMAVVTAAAHRQHQLVHFIPAAAGAGGGGGGENRFQVHLYVVFGQAAVVGEGVVGGELGGLPVSIPQYIRSDE